MIFFKLYTRVKIGNLRGLSSPEFLGYSRGDATTLRVTAEGILPLPVCQRGEIATLGVTGVGILPLSVCQRGNTATLWVTAVGILPLSVCKSGFFNSVGYIRGDTVTVCLSERGYGYCLSVREGILPICGLHSGILIQE